MGRRAFSAVGVAAAMMQSPADSFLGTSMRYPYVPSWCKSFATTTTSSNHGNSSGRGCPNCSAGSRNSSSAHKSADSSRRGDQAPQASGSAAPLPWGWQRPAGWRLACEVRGGHASERGGGNGAEDPGMDSDSSGKEQIEEIRAMTTTATAKTQQQGAWNKQRTPSSVPEMRSRGFLSVQPPPSGRGDDEVKVNIRERAGFSLFRCSAGYCEKDTANTGEISSSSPATTQVMMRWDERPRRALVLLKPDRELLPLAAETIDFLQREVELTVMVEAAAAKAVGEALNELRGETEARRDLEVFAPPERSREAIMGPKGGAGPSPPPEKSDGERVDFVLTLGGDGLLMYSNTLFRRSVPPHLCFNLGSMGFLAPFEYESMKEEIRRIVTGEMNVSLRMRLSARIIRDDQTSEAFHALNEIVIDRGSSPYLTNLECYCDEEHLTTVQADGLIIATPTGSTAYSMSAGGSMVHPCVPAILFTPICPHSLSFRPIVFPDTVVLRLIMPMEARAEARVSFDGKLSQPLRRGDTLVVKTSNFPVPTICKYDSTADWFTSLDQALGFNTRMRQRAFTPPSMDSVRTRNDDRFDD